LKGVEDLHTYVERNKEFVPNYGERYRNGEKIASGFVESAINQVVSQTDGEDGEETTDGVEPAWSTSSPADTNPGARRRVGEHLPALVSGFPPSRAGQESGVTVCCICRVRVETATCRTSTVTVNLIGGQHKGVI
jgi:hypothetical protein